MAIQTLDSVNTGIRFNVGIVILIIGNIINCFRRVYNCFDSKVQVFSMMFVVKLLVKTIVK